jgi:hypothetical protein
MAYVMAQWQVLSEKSEEHLELLKQSVELQKNDRKLWCYKESRIFKIVGEDSSVETWMYLDLYEDFKDFEGFIEAINARFETDEKLQKWRENFMSVIYPESWTMTQWTEEFRIT